MLSKPQHSTYLLKIAHTDLTLKGKNILLQKTILSTKSA